jgi:hypothetical protein
LPSLGWNHHLLPPSILYLDRDVILLNQSTDLCIFKIFKILESYDLAASMTLDPMATPDPSSSSSSSWSLDPSLIGIRQQGGTELLSLWRKQCLQSPNQTSRQGTVTLSLLIITLLTSLLAVLMSLLDNSPQFRFYPLSPLYNLRFTSFGFLSQSFLPLTTSSASLFSPPTTLPHEQQQQQKSGSHYSIQLRRIYFSISAIFEDTLERIYQTIALES